MVAAYQGGATAATVAARFGVHRSTVLRKLRAARMDRKLRNVGDDSELVARIRCLRGAGMSLRRIAAEVGVSHPSVHRLLVSNRMT
jgi:DNA-binding transcriptional regulator LsrR (DeoR family)